MINDKQPLGAVCHYKGPHEILQCDFSDIFELNGARWDSIWQVTDSTNESPLIGANVILEGTSLGAATDGEGIYEIKDQMLGNMSLPFLILVLKILKKYLFRI